jgi:hypothetical protein
MHNNEVKLSQKRKSSKLVMFEDILIEELFDDGSFLPASYALWHLLELIFYETKNPPIETQRSNWQEHRDKLLHRGHFHRIHRMSPESFANLMEMLRIAFVMNETVICQK